MSRIIILLSCMLSLTGCNITNYIRVKFENDDLKTQWQNGKRSSTVDSAIDVKPYVYISINGVDKFKMQLDTGASISILNDTPKVKGLNLTRGYDIELGGWGNGKNSQGYQTEVNSINIGAAQFNDVSFVYMPVSQSSYFSRADEMVFDGIIGHDLLKHFNWYIDSNNNHITISDQAYSMAPGDIAIPFEVSWSKLSIEADITLNNGKTIKQNLTVDTGSRHHLKLNTYHLDEYNPTQNSVSVTGADFGLSGQLIHQRVAIPNLSLNDKKFAHVKANIFNGGDDDYSIIGSALLNQTAYVIDYQKQVIYLKQGSSTQFKSQFNLLGLELRKLLSGAFVVRYVMPDMATAQANIQIGDEVLSINGISTEEINQTQWLAISNTSGSHQICIKRNDHCFKVAAKPIPGYSH